jgi:outer membrane protein TolC
MKGKIRLLTIILLASQLTFAQESKTIELSLQKCVQMAVEKNINVKTARIDKEKGTARKDEAQASLYPKINISASMTDNVALPTTLLPEAFGAMVGTPGKAVAVQMGSNYSSSAMLSISQVLYNQTAITALKLAKKADEINELGIQKSKEEVGIQVAKMYMLALTTLEQQKLIESNIERAERLKKITQVTVDNGVGKQVDLDRINVNLENTYTQLSNTKAAQEQQMNTIKYLLDMPLDTQIQLTDTVGTELLNSKPVLLNDFSSNVNIRMLESQKEIYSLNKKLVNAGYIPSLSLSGQAAYQGLQNKFSTYFSSGSDNKWFPYANFTVTLSVPVFDGFEKRSKARQVEMDTRKTELTLNNTKEALNLDYRNALNTYTNNKINVSRQKQNLQLAEKVYKETSLKYKEGMAAMSSLLQDETGLNNAQAGYLTALYNFKDAELKIMSLNGAIKNLVN